MNTFIKVSVLGAALVWSAGAYAADAAHGAAVFKQCKICHQVGPGAKAGVGPEQNNLIGSTAGSRPGYNYSPAMKAKGAEGLTWTPENLDKFLADPKGFVPGTKMVFPGLKKPEDRADVIAYLETQTGK